MVQTLADPKSDHKNLEPLPFSGLVLKRLGQTIKYNLVVNALGHILRDHKALVPKFGSRVVYKSNSSTALYLHKYRAKMKKPAPASSSSRSSFRYIATIKIHIVKTYCSFFSRLIYCF
jgi:hypothetical protein